MGKIRILIADDEVDYLDLISRRLEGAGHEVMTAPDGTRALELIQEQDFDVGLFDYQMPGLDGIELMQEAQKIQPLMQYILITGHGTIASAIQAMKEGASDYITKPSNFDEILLVIAKAYDKRVLLQQNLDLKEALKRSKMRKTMVGDSPPIQAVHDIIHKVAATTSTVLIEGESGTGKELVAENIHYLSDRSENPFIIINAGALPSELLESELFGHAKGAFTGAHEAKKGLVQVADGGTLFLDEIGEMELALQVKLLRFLETGEVRPVGDNRTDKVDVRILAATNRKLEEEVAAGNFRQDLYYRLNIIRVEVPPLRERGSDIQLLASYFLQNFDKSQTKSLSQEARLTLETYSFPGNIRELANLIQRGVILSSGPEITAADIWGQPLDQGATPALTLRQLEENHILATMRATQGNKSQTAEILGISLRNLYRKLDDYKAAGIYSED